MRARLAPGSRRSDAYRFARGEQVTSNTGQPVKLSRPLDFLVVTDHSDNMGFFPDLFAGKPDLLADPTGRKWYDMIRSGKGAEAAIEIIVAFSHGTFPKDLMYFPGTRAYRSAWQETIAAAEQFQRAGPLHRLHWIRMDLEHRRQQSASQCHLPRQWRQGEPGRAIHRVSAEWKRQSGRAVEMDGRLRKEDRRQRVGDRAQRQLEQRLDVPRGRGLRQANSTANMPSSARSGSGFTRRRRRRAPASRIRSCRRTTSSPPSRSGTRAISTAALQRKKRCSNSSMSARPIRTV